jgi:uncharacterized protein YPO0396
MNKRDHVRLAKAIGQLEDAKAVIEELAEAEQEKFDNMTKGLQAGERGQAIEQAASSLSDAQSDLEAALDKLGEIE